MAFLPNIPNSGAKLRTSQPQLLANNQQLDASMDVDHFKFSDTTGDTGKHKFAHFVSLTGKSLASPTMAADELAYYVKDVSSVPQIFYREPSSGTEQQVSGSIKSAIAGTAPNGSFNTLVSGECPLPGGLGLKWGSFNNTIGTISQAFAYTTNFGLTNFTSTTYLVIAIATRLPTISNSPRTPSSLSATGFTLSGFADNFTINWIAIGK